MNDEVRVTNDESPRPWSIRPHLPDAHFEVVADTFGNTVGTATLAEDAALIVEAVNGRDRLRGLMQRLENEDEQMEELDTVCDTDRARRIDALLREAREALGEGEQRMKEGGDK